ncbi:hypothetical protein PHYSODRAFT_308175 [Phytophthora sojae]|uniref:Uncharacterized protein n=1 Tax=Phytophthora sojae (strain P6497) TaxID=1094619 RepID=G5AIM6_PHYSP|nr:hypothetical protein PHYSODRAFT_308175 [Phytophthora sojae]EGZ04636.1 hypothetical protein PHYSODRAFT_308175 [Phytophthora sojae]|eukprot:XP_009539927.1 hypothetical protein PHYSODRAFT_308175 [Phytophthora sojae]
MVSLRSGEVAEAGENSGVPEDRAFEKLKEAIKLLNPSGEGHINKLFKKFKVGAVESNVLASSELQNWAAAVAKVSKKNPPIGEVQMVSTLTTRYGDEALTRMLIAAKDAPGLAGWAGKLEAAQLRS